MAHAEWCGKPCGECINPCRLDEEIPCSPSCTLLNPDGSRQDELCIADRCDAYCDWDAIEESEVENMP